MKMRDITPFSVRLPEELRDRLEESKKKSGRSMNAEILFRIERGLLARPLDQYSDGDLIRELIDRHEGDPVSIRIGKSSEK